MSRVLSLMPVYEYTRNEDGTLNFKGKAGWSRDIAEAMNFTLDEMSEGDIKWKSGSIWEVNGESIRS